MTTSPSPWNAPKSPLLVDDASGPLYAGFWRRWAAAFTDGILLWIAMVVLAIVLPQSEWTSVPTFALGWLYHALMQSSARQATLGKMAFGIKVARSDGERISFLRATARYFSTFLSALLLMVGYLMAAFTSRKQALHDFIADTVVVRADASPAAVQGGGGTMKLSPGVWLFALLLGPAPLGILAAIAIPAYQGYAVRSKMVEAIAVGRAAQDSVTEYFNANGRLPKSLEEAGVKTTESGRNVARIEGQFTAERAVIRTYPSLKEAEGGAVIHTAPATRPLVWDCSTDKIPHKRLPANCRNPTS